MIELPSHVFNVLNTITPKVKSVVVLSGEDKHSALIYIIC